MASTEYATVPIFPSLHAGTEYTITYRTLPWESEQRITGTLEMIRVAPLNGGNLTASTGVPMLGITPTDGRKDARVDIAWQSITSVGLARS